MTSKPYALRFKRSALKEWQRLDAGIQAQFKKKLAERLHQPIVPGDRLRGLTDCYKIKLRSAGYRLVYEVHGDACVVTVIAIGKRDRQSVYKKAGKRLT
jgi:mRNA interferase RelE/StbE